jgi:hypothetical protein
MHYKRLVVTFQGKVKYALIMGPADTFDVRQRIRDVERRVYLAMEGENTMCGLGLVSPSDRIGVRLEDISGYDSSHDAPVDPDNVMVEQMIYIIKERVWAPALKPKVEWTIGGVLKTLWQNFMEFLDEFGEEAKKNPAPIDRAFFWM